jgi:hypothetical protein
MATTETVPVSVWSFDPRLTATGPAELRGALAVTTDELWAVGIVANPGSGRSSALVGRWTTRDFGFVKPAAADQEVRLSGVDYAGEDVWAVGWVSDGGGGGRPRIERYPRLSEPVGVAVDSPAQDRNSALHGVAMLSASQGWAVGGSGPASDVDFTRTLIVRWDGKTWQEVPSPSPGTVTNQLDAVSALSTDDVWAVGHSTGGDVSEALVLHWDGSVWTQVPTPDLADGIELLDVAVVGPDSVWAVGTSVPDPRTTKPWRQLAVVLHWDGLSWRSVLPEMVSVTQISSVAAVSETDVWFAGYSQLPGGPETAHVEHWDGQQLRVEASGVSTRGDLASALEGVCAVGSQVMAVGWHIPVSATSKMPQPGALSRRRGNSM